MQSPHLASATLSIQNKNSQSYDQKTLSEHLNLHSAILSSIETLYRKDTSILILLTRRLGSLLVM